MHLEHVAYVTVKLLESSVHAMDTTAIVRLCKFRGLLYHGHIYALGILDIQLKCLAE